MRISWTNKEINTQLYSKGTTVIETSGTAYPETRRQTSPYLNLHQNRYVVVVVVYLAQQPPQWAMASSFTRFLDHTQRRITVGRTPLDE